MYNKAHSLCSTTHIIAVQLTVCGYNSHYVQNNSHYVQYNLQYVQYNSQYVQHIF